MAGNIKGITIEFRGDTTKLNKALSEIGKESKSLDRELKQLNNALKFDPKNTTLLAQKMTVLREKIGKAEEKLKVLKQAQKDMDASGVDKNSAEYRKLQREIIETEGKVKSLKRQTRELSTAKLSALGEQFKEIGGKIRSVGKSMTMYVTGPLAAIGAKAAASFAEVDKTMQLTNKTMKNTSEEAELLDTAMKTAAANSTFGMTDAATATLNFARAGLKAEQAASALAPAMNLAAGEGGNLDTVSAGLVATINGFQDDFKNAAKYADVFANACNNSALDVDSLSSAMSVAAPIFSAAGYDVKDAALYMGIMANNGIEASKAANSLKTGFARLLSPTKQTDQAMAELGISITDQNGEMKDTITIQKELHKAFSKLTEAEQVAYASRIFGKNQMAPWLALINTAPSSVDALSKSLEKEGTTAEMSEAMMSGFGGSLEKLKSSVDVLVTSLGQALAPTILKVSNFIQTLVDKFNALDPKTQRIIAIIGVVVAAIGPLLIIIGTLISSIGSIMGVVAKLMPMLLGISPVVLAVIGVIVALIAVGVLLYKNWDKIKAWAKKHWTNIKNIIVATVNIIKNKFTELRNKVSEIWNGIKSKVTTTAENIRSSAVNKFAALKTKIGEILSGLREKVGSIFTSLKDKITAPIQKAKEMVESAIAAIKRVLSGGLSFPKINLPKLPKLKITGKFSLNPPSVPSISWNANGAIFTRPTVLQGVGEAGAEAVLPLDRLWKEMDKIYGNSGGNTVTINVYPSAGQDPKQIATEVERRMTKALKQKQGAWA